MACEKCPCPGVCLARPVFCQWAADPSAHPVQLKSICGASAGSRQAQATAVEPASPSALALAANGLAAAGRVAIAAGTALVRGESVREAVFVDEAKAAGRLAICQACPTQAYNPATQRCGKCTCYMPLKTRLATEEGECPDGHW